MKRPSYYCCRYFGFAWTGFRLGFIKACIALFDRYWLLNLFSSRNRPCNMTVRCGSCFYGSGSWKKYKSVPFGSLRPVRTKKLRECAVKLYFADFIFNDEASSFLSNSEVVATRERLYCIERRHYIIVRILKNRHNLFWLRSFCCCDRALPFSRNWSFFNSNPKISTLSRFPSTGTCSLNDSTSPNRSSLWSCQHKLEHISVVTTFFRISWIAIWKYLLNGW